MPDPRPLTVLRAEIDALDRALLDLLARRMAVVTEIAALKRAGNIALRDRSREQALRIDRAREATARGLPPGLSDAVFAAVVRASREHLAAQGAPIGHRRVGTALTQRLSTVFRRASHWLDAW